MFDITRVPPTCSYGSGYKRKWKLKPNFSGTNNVRTCKNFQKYYESFQCWFIFVTAFQWGVSIVGNCSTLNGRRLLPTIKVSVRQTSSALYGGVVACKDQHQFTGSDSSQDLSMFCVLSILCPKLSHTIKVAIPNFVHREQSQS